MGRLGQRVPLLVLGMIPVVPARAHEGEVAGWPSWSLAPEIVLPLLLAAWLYGRGVCRLWRASGVGRGMRRREALAFAAGWCALVLALVSPLDGLGIELFAAHMVQHEVLMLIAAPLLVLGRPLAPFLWVLPLAWRRRLGRWGHASWVRGGWRASTRAAAAWAIHGAVLWLWHVPGLFEAALVGTGVHILQHLSFLVSALLFWWALIHGRDGAMGYGMATLYLFTTAVHTSVLGALLTFARSAWYPVYADTAPLWGLSALEDQQLGGLIMWVPGGAVFVLAGLVFVARCLQESERRGLRREGQGLHGQ